MPTLCTILIGSRAWLWPAVIGLVVLLVLIWNAYRAAPTDRPTRLAMAICKAVGLALLAMFLIEPMWAGMRVRPGANVFVVLADNSQSLAMHDAQDTESRGQALRGLAVDADGRWIGRLAEQFDVRRYVFDTRLRAADDFSDLAFDGRASRLISALHDVRQRLRGRSIAGVLVLTDGNATDLASQTSLDATGLPPVYPVVAGDGSGLRDLGVASIATTQTAFEDAPVMVRCEVSHQGYATEPIVAQLVDEAGKVVGRQDAVGPRDGAPMAFDFQVRPESRGVTFYTLRVASQDQIARFESGEQTEQNRDDTPTREATWTNNVQQVMVDRGGGPFRVLYFTGRPNWEYKFLRRALADDDQLMLTGLVRIADKERKFTFRGRGEDDTNPLFQGFDKQDEATERYDEAVFIRLDTETPDALRRGFPATAEQLFAFHAVILDDVERAALTRDQLDLLAKFVAHRGGGLLMLGGAESFAHGGYQHTSIARMLPIYLDASPDAPTGRVRLSLTREGWLQPWVRLRSTEDDERVRLANMPTFVTLNRLRGIKPGASVLAEVKDERNTAWPALVAQRYGRGRAAALTVGDLWRWRLKQLDDNNDTPIDEGERDQPKAWRQMIRWLVADVPARVSIDVEPRMDHPDTPLDLRVRVRNDKFEAMDNARVAINISTPEGETIELLADTSLDEPGLYQATYLPRIAGAYRATVSVQDPAGMMVGQVDTGWTADPAGDEFRSVAPNRALLTELATQTGGEVVEPDDLAALVADLPHRQADEMEQAVTPLWHRWWMLALAIGCLVGEWGLRRWKGLP